MAYLMIKSGQSFPVDLYPSTSIADVRGWFNEHYDNIEYLRVSYAEFKLLANHPDFERRPGAIPEFHWFLWNVRIIGPPSPALVNKMVDKLAEMARSVA